MVEENKCLWCGTTLKNGLFCSGGGNTIGLSNAGEKTLTKSFCYESFLSVFKNITLKLKHPLTEEEKIFILYEDKIKIWYQSIPLVYEPTPTPDGEDL